MEVVRRSLHSGGAGRDSGTGRGEDRATGREPVAMDRARYAGQDLPGQEAGLLMGIRIKLLAYETLTDISVDGCFCMRMQKR